MKNINKIKVSQSAAVGIPRRRVAAVDCEVLVPIGGDVRVVRLVHGALGRARQQRLQLLLDLVVVRRRELERAALLAHAHGRANVVGLAAIAVRALMCVVLSHAANLLLLLLLQLQLRDHLIARLLQMRRAAAEAGGAVAVAAAAIEGVIVGVDLGEVLRLAGGATGRAWGGATAAGKAAGSGERAISAILQ